MAVRARQALEPAGPSTERGRATAPKRRRTTAVHRAGTAAERARAAALQRTRATAVHRAGATAERARAVSMQRARATAERATTAERARAAEGSSPAREPLPRPARTSPSAGAWALRSSAPGAAGVAASGGAPAAAWPFALKRSTSALGSGPAPGGTKRATRTSPLCPRPPAARTTGSRRTVTVAAPALPRSGAALIAPRAPRTEPAAGATGAPPRPGAAPPPILVRSGPVALRAPGLRPPPPGFGTTLVRSGTSRPRAQPATEAAKAPLPRTVVSFRRALVRRDLFRRALSPDGRRIPPGTLKLSSSSADFRRDSWATAR